MPGGRRVLQHVRVHRRGEQRGRADGEREGGQEVVGQAERQPGDGVRGGRGDQEQVGLLGERDVADVPRRVARDGGVRGVPGVPGVPVARLVRRPEQPPQHRLPGDGGERERAHEGGRRAGEHHLDAVAALDERPDEFRRPVGPDPPGDPEDDLPAPVRLPPLRLRSAPLGHLPRPAFSPSRLRAGAPGFAHPRSTGRSHGRWSRCRRSRPGDRSRRPAAFRLPRCGAAAALRARIPGPGR